MKFHVFFLCMYVLLSGIPLRAQVRLRVHDGLQWTGLSHSVHTADSRSTMAIDKAVCGINK